MTVNGIQRSLGRHDRLESAVAAYKVALHEAQGVFAAASELNVVFYDLEQA